ncbi:MAG: DUF4199 domain-containing protein [Gemmatimonadetes bacterium]|nr:DUF4199 domain-containing protein [Gemmatimonadota bacterium]
MRRVVLTFGLIAGGILAASMLLALPFRDQIGLDRAVVVGYTTMVLAFLMIYFGVRSYRDNVAGGSVSFGRAFAVGGLITLVATACYVVTWEFVYFKVTPDYGEAYAAQAIEKARQSGASEAELAATQKQMEEFQIMYDKPLYNAAITFLEPLPVGLLFTLLTAGIMSRRRRDGAGQGALARAG